MTLSELPITELIDHMYTAVRAEVCYEQSAGNYDQAKADQFAAKTQEVFDALTTRVHDDQPVARLRAAITNHERILSGLGDKRDRPNWIMISTAQDVIDAERLVIYVDGYASRFVDVES